MATDWAADVKKYVADADEAAIAGIVRYCGIALRNRDSQLVAFSDKAELELVRNNYLKKKLGLTQSDAVLDKTIAKVGEVMKADRTKNRVTVYYLLAAEFKKLGLFVKKAAEKAKAPAKAVAAKAPTKAPAKADAKAPAAKAAPKSAAKAAGAVAAVAGAAAATKAAAKKAPAAKAPAKATAAPKKAAAAAKPAAAAKKVAAPKKAAAPKKVATLKATPAKAKGLVDKAADAASDAGKTGAAAVAGTVAAVGAAGAAAVAAASGAAEAAKDTAAKAVGAAGDAAGAAAGAVTGAAGAAADKAGALFSGGGQAAGSSEDDSGLGWLWWLLGLALVGLLIWWLLSGRTAGDNAVAGAPTEAAAGVNAGAAASGAAADLSAAPAEGSVAIPAGAGVTSELRDGKPVVKVYFDTAKTDVAPAFGAAAGGLKGWLDGHAGSKLAISGYSDPSGNAAANAELSKKRAQAVQAALVSAGIPAEAAELVKPAESADASVPKEAARRVEVTVQ